MRLKKTFVSILLILTVNIHAFAKETLVFAVDIVRHGDRTPTPHIAIPKSSHKWPEGMGQLTARGMNQGFKLGTFFRNKYVYKYHLLPEHYKNGTLRVFSTDSDRTLMTAQALLLGLYPLGTGPHLVGGKPSLPYGYQPIPIHIREHPLKLPGGKKKYAQLVTQHVTSTPIWKNKLNQVKDKFKKWSLATGIDIKKFDIKLMIALADTFYVHRVHNINIPSDLSKQDVEDIMSIGRWGHLKELHTKEIAEYHGSSILSSIAEYFRRASLHQGPLKYVLFSDHDTTIGSIMTILQKPLRKLPAYVANLNFSLFQKENNYLVRIRYNNKSVILPGCSNKVCTLKQFIKLADKQKR